MYTQCPECLTAFRVTAGLLQQASGRVRCGSCGHAFSALEQLSENPPPADSGDDASTGDEAAEDALLDTFNDLGGFDDIRIEDTGVEWRVVDEEDGDDPRAEAQRDSAGTGSVRWFIANEDDEQPAEGPGPLPEVRDEVPVDERLAAQGDDTGIFVEEELPGPETGGTVPADAPSSGTVPASQVALDLPPTDAGEPRYDDNTPLPDDVGEASGRPAEPEPPRRRATDQIEPRSPEFDGRQVDLELGAAEDWRELLEEFGERGEGRGAPPAAALPGDSDMPSDIDTQFDLKALEMGIDVSGSRPAPAADPVTEAVDGAEVEPVTGDAPAAHTGPESDTDGEAYAAELERERHDEPATVDFDPGAGSLQEVDFEVRAEDETGAPDIDFDPGEERAAEVSDFGLAEAFDAGGAARDDDEREAREREAALEAELDAAYAAEEETPVSPSSDRDAKYEVPPQTEEEMTVNMQIDQDLMRLAAEEGFSSTLTGERKVPQDSLLVETIIMEGDFVRSALDKELDDIVETVGGVDEDPRRLLDTYIKSKEPIRGGRRRTDPPSYTVVASVVVLTALLLAQVVHAYRDALATHGAFNRTVGSVYRLFGAALVPEWDVRGWRFEATSGSTDQAEAILTIRSRISNQSGGDLPYPLLHVALTDRFEEVIGSRVLEPADYLAGGRETRPTVAAGEELGATIRLGALSQEATGFKLNVCYREDAARLRCATGDFRN